MQIYCSNEPVSHLAELIVFVHYATTTTTILWPFVQEYPGVPVPAETFTHPLS